MFTSPRRASLATLAVAACALAAASPSQAADATFTPAPDVAFDPASGPQALATGDFDSDGKQDFAVADFVKDAAQVRLGNGDGTFKQAPAIGNLSRPQAIAVGDLNSDGVEDLAVAAGVASTREIAVLFGVGDGTFRAGAYVDLPTFATSLAIADFNGDGREDLAATSYSHVSVRLGDAGGQWSTGPDIAFGPSPESVRTGDFDGNGTKDLAVVLNDGAARVGILPGKGDGSFEAAKTSSIPNRARYLTVGDFDGDGRDDVAVGIPAEDRVSIRLGKGDGTLADDLPDVGVGNYPWALAVGDLDADGREDLAVGHGTIGGDGHGVNIRLGTGDGSFTDGGDLASGNLPAWLAAGDLNADGREDLLIAQYVAKTVGVRLGAGEGPLAGNLLVNGGFEQGLAARLPTQSPAVPGWTVTGGMTFVRYGSTSSLGVPSWLDAPRYGGGFNYLWGGDSTGTGGLTTATQAVDVSGRAEGIDGGRAAARLSAYLGGAQKYADNMRVSASFLAADGTSLGELTVGPVSPDDR